MLFAIAAIVSVVVVIQQKGDSTKTIGWLLSIVCLPVVGVICYVVLGQNRRSRNAKIVEPIELVHVGNAEESQPAEWDNYAYPYMLRMLKNMAHTSPTHNNEVELLIDGEAKFASLFDAIRNAKDHIHVEYCIIKSDKIGSEFCELLAQKAKEGLTVRLIYDDFGSAGLSKKHIKMMKAAGVEVYPFLPFKFPFLDRKLLFRTHRKIVIVDGTVSFVGGLNVADRYIYGLKHLGKWHDIHIKITGEATRWLQRMFLTHWHFVSKQLIDDNRYFPALPQVGNKTVQMVGCGPDSDLPEIMHSYIAAISEARKSVYIETPYFIPSEGIMMALKNAALRGVDVRMLIPSRSDAQLTQWASCSYVEELLSVGAKVYRYTPGFVHAKVMTIDGVFCSVGTSNMDNRSFYFDYEVNAWIFNEQTTQELEKVFFDDLAVSEELLPELWSNRPIGHQLMESLSKILSPLL